MRWIVVLAVVAGCDEIEGLEHLDTVFDRCAPQPFDVHRYQLDATGNHTKITYDEGIAACAARGLEPLTIDDEQERALLGPAIVGWQAKVAADDRIWVGLSDDAIEGTWVAADQCPNPDLFWDVGKGGVDATQNCAAIDPSGKLEDGTCAGDFGSYATTAIACELPRWPNAGCADAAMMHGTYVFDATPRSYSDAIAFCAQQRAIVVEIDSGVELGDVIAAAHGETVWLGASKSTGPWVGTSGCPQIVPWADNEPAPVDGDCASMVGAGAIVTPCAELHRTLCETGL